MQSLAKKIAFSLVPLLLLGLVAETGLRVVGVGAAPEADSDPYVGFAGELPLFVDEIDDGVRYRRTAKNKLAFFNDQRFPAEKTAATRRVFCMGGSTTYGHPYFDPTSFCGWLRVTLPIVAPDYDWQVVNAGGISYASYRVVALMKQLSLDSPDYFVVYSGHNEFLEERTYGALRDRPAWIRKAELLLGHSRVFRTAQSLVHPARPQLGQTGGRSEERQLPAEVEAQLESSTGFDAYRRDDPLRARILERYGENLGRMDDVARAAGARLVFVVPADNLTACSPFKSEPDRPMSREESDRFDDGLAEAEQALHRGQAEVARRGFEAALAASPRHAHAHYGLARALFAQGRVEDAMAAFTRARDEDVCPLRALSPIGEAVRRTARERGVPLIDYPALLVEQSAGDAHRAFGEEWFLDHVHPGIEGHRVLARALLKTMHDSGWLAVDPKRVAEPLAHAERAHLASMDPRDHGRALKNLAKVLSWAGKTEDAARAARRALEILGEDAECQFVLAELESLRGETDRAIALLERSVALDPSWAKAWNNLGVERMRAGRLEEALAAYDAALRADPEHASARFNRGNSLRRLGRFPEAAEALEAAVEQDAEDVDAWFNLSRTYEDMGRKDAALDAMRRVLALDPEDRDAAEIVERLGQEARPAESGIGAEASARSTSIDPASEAT